MSTFKAAAKFIDNQLLNSTPLSTPVSIPGSQIGNEYQANVSPDRYLNYRPEAGLGFPGNTSYGNFVQDVTLVNTGNPAGFTPLSVGTQWCTDNSSMVQQHNDFTSNYMKIFGK